MLISCSMGALTVTARTAGRAYVSEDAGATWSFLGQGLTDASVLGLEADPFLHDTLYAATEGGLYTLTHTTGP